MVPVPRSKMPGPLRLVLGPLRLVPGLLRLVPGPLQLVPRPLRLVPLRQPQHLMSVCLAISRDPANVATCICAALLVSGQIGTLDMLVCAEIVHHRGQLSVLPHVVVRVPCSKPFQQSVSLETRLIKVHRPGCRMQVALREVCQGPPKLAWVAPE